MAILSRALPPATYGAQVLLRDAAGLLGLCLLTATCADNRVAWTLPTGYAFTVYLAAGTGHSGLRPVWAFLMQPAGSPIAIVTAVVLLTSGILSWAVTPDLRSA
jgi:hypothetical protein